MICPTPRQRGQVCETWKNPRELTTWPRPPQVGQLIAREPASAPLPWHFVAGVELADFDFLFHAESRFLERDLHVVTQIGAALPAFAIGAVAPPPKNVSKIPPPPPPPPKTSRKISNGSWKPPRAGHALAKAA